MKFSRSWKIKNMDQEKIYKMNLHEIIDGIGETGFLRILRVAGGWVYISNSGGHLASSFVPFSDEFVKRQPLKPAIPSTRVASNQ